MLFFFTHGAHVPRRFRWVPLKSTVKGDQSKATGHQPDISFATVLYFAIKEKKLKFQVREVQPFDKYFFLSKIIEIEKENGDELIRRIKNRSKKEERKIKKDRRDDMNIYERFFLQNKNIVSLILFVVKMIILHKCCKRVYPNIIFCIFISYFDFKTWKMFVRKNFEK